MKKKKNQPKVKKKPLVNQVVNVKLLKILLRENQLDEPKF